MDQKSRKKSSGGFSLLELLIAMSLTIGMLGMAATALTSGFRIREREESVTDAVADAQRALNIMFGSVPWLRRRYRGCALSNREIHTRRFDLCLGHSRRLFNWTARVNSRSIVFVGLLCAARHQDTASLRDYPRRTYKRTWLSLLDSPPRLASPRPALGCGRIDGFGRNCGMGRVRFTQEIAEPSHWTDRIGSEFRREVVGCRDHRNRSRLGLPLFARSASSPHSGCRGTRRVRRYLFCGELFLRSDRVERRHHARTSAAANNPVGHIRSNRRFRSTSPRRGGGFAA